MICEPKKSANFLRILIAAIAISFITSNSIAVNILVDPGFESGMPSPGGYSFGGWNPWNSNVFFSQDYARSGLWSLKVAPGSFDYYYGGAVQLADAAPGVSYTFSGWLFSPTTLTGGGIGFLRIEFLDPNFSALATPETEGSPWHFLSSSSIDSSSPANTWIQLSVTGLAPANTTYIWFETIAATAGGSDSIYFDDMSLTAVPEPCFGAFFVVSAVLLRIRRK